MARTHPDPAADRAAIIHAVANRLRELADECEAAARERGDHDTPWEDGRRTGMRQAADVLDSEAWR